MPQHPLSPPDAHPARVGPGGLSRRTFLGGVSLAAATAGGLVVPHAAWASTDWRSENPFGLGIASGDPTATGVVLWTRLAVDPLAEDGRGGMPPEPVTVQWQVSNERRFRRVIRSGRAVAQPDAAHAVHVELENLTPGREYFYRFRVGRHLSEVGRALTMPRPGDSRALHMIALSCTHYEGGYFTAYRHAAEEQPDLVFALGDYIYEGGGLDGRTRKHPGPLCIELDQYRRRYALYKNEAETQELHAAAPWIVTWDDHEVQDNWGGIYPKNGVPSEVFAARRAAATQAYYENMPLRRTSAPSGVDMQLYRRLRWGDLADFHVLDSRQYRDKQACHDGGKTWWFADCAEQDDPNRSLTGQKQEQWLLDGFAASPSTWQVLPQGDFFAQRDITVGEVDTFGSDSWDGYSANRDRIRDGWVERGIDNAVVLTGDVHMHFANEIKADFDDPDSSTVGVELVTTSITSGGDGSDNPRGGEDVLAENPHIRYIRDRRGYLSLTVDRDEMRADFKTMPHVSEAGAPIGIDKTYVIPAGEPGLHEA